jgi:hypothetical protein
LEERFAKKMEVYERPMDEGGPLRYEDGRQKLSAFFSMAFSLTERQED